MELRESAISAEEELKAVRRTLHGMAEPAREEYRTNEYIYDYLFKLGPDKLQRMAYTGIRAVFYAKEPAKTVAIRADMDALPVLERTGRSFKSKTKGVMHACGHDGHMAIALVTASIVSKARDTMRNTYVFIFQPSEEMYGGALPMIEERVLKDPDVDEIYALHLWPYLPGGEIGIKGGPLMAGMRDLNIEVKGKSCHGAKPQDGTDALVAAAQLVVALQSIVSREIDPLRAAVLTIGRIEGGETRNVLCGQVRMEGTMRAFENERMHFLQQRVTEMAHGIAKMYGVTCKLKETMNYPPLINNEKLAQAAREKVECIANEAVRPVMMSEDFANYMRYVPGLYAFLGVADDRYNHPLHSCRFDFDEKWLVYGVEYFLRVTDFV